MWDLHHELECWRCSWLHLGGILSDSNSWGSCSGEASINLGRKGRPGKSMRLIRNNVEWRACINDTPDLKHFMSFLAKYCTSCVVRFVYACQHLELYRYWFDCLYWEPLLICSPIGSIWPERLQISDFSKWSHGCVLRDLDLRFLAAISYFPHTKSTTTSTSPFLRPFWPVFHTAQTPQTEHTDPIANTSPSNASWSAIAAASLSLPTAPLAPLFLCVSSGSALFSVPYVGDGERLIRSRGVLRILSQWPPGPEFAWLLGF